MTTIVTVIGARPQFVKMALVSRALKTRRVREVIVHTGQHYNEDMSSVFFSELKIPKPDYNLAVGSGSHAVQVGRMLRGVERVLRRESPAIVLVYGDTNSTLAGALAAAKMKIRLAHVEAGLRSHNLNMPEEVNRVVTDSVSTIFFCPTRTAADNLKHEGHAHNVYLVGDVMYDSVKKVMAHGFLLRPSGFGGQAWDMGKKVNEKGPYILCTIHRAENTDSRRNLNNIFKALGLIEEKVVAPLHPRTAKYIRRYGIKVAANIRIINPVGYEEMLALEKGAAVIITDSGGVQKEALIFGVPCVTLRNETEWVETVQSGANKVAGTDPDKIIKAVISMSRRCKRVDPEKLYGDGRAHQRIADILKKELKA